MWLRIRPVAPACDGVDGALRLLRGEISVPDRMKDFEHHAGFIAEQPERMHRTCLDMHHITRAKTPDVVLQGELPLPGLDVEELFMVGMVMELGGLTPGLHEEVLQRIRQAGRTGCHG